MGIVISALVTFWVGFLIYKKYKPQPVLFLGGMILMYIAVLCGYGTILPEKASTGSWFFDAFEFMRKTMSSNAAGLGLNIMSVGAFARYMDRIGASRSLVRLTIKPLLALKSPYLVLFRHLGCRHVNRPLHQQCIRSCHAFNGNYVPDSYRPRRKPPCRYGSSCLHPVLRLEPE